MAQRLQFYDRHSKVWVSMGQASSSRESVMQASAALVRELTGGGIYYLPTRSVVEVARAAFKKNLDDTTRIDHHLDVATSCIRILEQNLARGRKLGILSQSSTRTRPSEELYDLELADGPAAGRVLLAHPLLTQSALT
jgi:hypothetical protein